MSKPRLLDLFCGAGGAGVGYHRAGFEVVGVDIAAQAHYPFEFHQADALTFPLDGFDAIHASPPCKAFNALRVLWNRGHADLLTPCRERLQGTGVPWVIENVPGASMRGDVMLCGSQFGLQVKRHRYFEFDAPVLLWHEPCRHDLWTDGRPVGVYGHTGGGGRRSGNHGFKMADWEQAMDIDWMSRDELAQAIPPAYTEFIGEQLLAHIAPRADALVGADPSHSASPHSGEAHSEPTQPVGPE